MSSFTSNSEEGRTVRPSRGDRSWSWSASGRRRSKRRSPVRRFNLGLIGLVVLVILSEIFVFRNVMFYGHSPGFIGQMGELQASFVAQDPARIRVAVIGDSQAMDALRPDLLAAHSPYEADEIFNFSLSGGSAYDMEKTWRRYASQVPQLEKAIVTVGEHQFNEARTAEDIKFRFEATLVERMRVMDRDNYGELLLGWPLRSYGMRTVWTQMIEKWRADELRESVPAHPGGLPPVTWSPSTDRTYEYAKDTADRWFDSFHMHGVRTRAFERLVRDLAATGAEVVIVQLPRAELFEQAVREHYPEEQGAIHQYIAQVAEQYGAQVAYIPNDELELDVHFRDTNHVNPEGARWVSAYAAKRWLGP